MSDQPSQVVQTVYDFRTMLDANEKSMVDEMAKQWIKVEGRLEWQINQLAEEIARRVANGEEVTEQILWRMQTFKQTQAEVVKQIKIYNQTVAVPVIEKYQTINGMLGFKVANDTIAATFNQVGASIPYWQKLNEGAVKHMVGMAGDGSPLVKLMKQSYGLSTAWMMDSMVNSIARGKGVVDMARDMREACGIGLDRSLLVARTEAMRAYRMASTEQYRQSGVVDGFYRIVKKPTACMACLVLDGQFYKLEDEMEDHPRGKCGTIPAVHGMPKPYWQNGKDWFTDQPEEDQQRIMGKEMWKLWKQEKFPLDYLAKLKPNPVWGAAPQKINLDDLYKKLGIERPKGKVSIPGPKPAPPIPPVPTVTPPKPTTIMNQKLDKYAGVDKEHKQYMDQIMDYGNAHNFKVDIAGVRQEFLEGIANTFKEMDKVSPQVMDRMKLFALGDPIFKRKKYAGTIAFWDDRVKEMKLNPKYYKTRTFEDFRAMMKANMDQDWFYKVPDTKFSEYIINHEFGHATHRLIEDEFYAKDLINNDHKLSDKFNSLWSYMLQQKVGRSTYSKHNRAECFAESYAQMNLTPRSNWNEATNVLQDILIYFRENMK